MSIVSELQSLSHDAEIELFVLSDIPGDEYEQFHFCTHRGVRFAGYDYDAIACEIDGIAYTSEGSAPRPKIRFSDAGLVVSSWIHQYEGLEGATLTLKKTLRRFLSDGSSPDGTAVKTTDIYTVSHRSQEIPGKIIEFELVSSFDFVDEILPNRRCIIKCPWLYRRAECGYTGSGYTIANQPTSDYGDGEDVCAKTLTACSKRFGKTAILPYGGFPALGRF